MNNTQVLTLADVLGILKRRKNFFVVPFSIIMTVAVVIAFVLPPIYRSMASILIEQQEIPQDLIKTTVTSYAAERIQLIRTRIRTSENLKKIIEKYDLYPEERQRGEMGMVLSTVRANIGVEMVSADIIDPSRKRSGRAMIAFNIWFDDESPKKAKLVTDELVSLYLAENQKIRTQKAEVTSDFLEDESEKYRIRITELESKLASYKERNVGQLPEFMKINVSLIERMERDLEDSMRQMTGLEERRVAIEDQLLQVSPYIGTSPRARLRQLQSDYSRKIAVYSEDHPDMARTRREIETLKLQTGLEDDPTETLRQLSIARRELSDLKQKYADNHPDVVKSSEEVDALSKTLENVSVKSSSKYADNPDNPQYLSLLTQLKSANSRIRAEQQKIQRSTEKLAIYEERLMQMPRVEQEGLSLKRDYENAIAKYKELKGKQMQAELAEQLEKDSKAERFSILEPADQPNLPIKPNRIGIVLLGIVLALGAGVVTGATAEFFDHRLYGAGALTAVMGESPLSIIPKVEAEQVGMKGVGNMALLFMMLFPFLVLVSFIIIS